MEANTQQIPALRQLLDHDTRKFTSAEIQLKRTLPGWINRSNSLKLKTVLQKYLGFVEEHVQKMNSFFEEENIVSLSLHNHVMEAFISETEEKLANCTDAEVKDACMLASIQLINHYKISTYGTAAAFSKALGMEKPAIVFHEAEVNEKQIDDRLSQLAEHEINASARSPFALPR